MIPFIFKLIYILYLSMSEFAKGSVLQVCEPGGNVIFCDHMTPEGYLHIEIFVIG